jgi:glutamyl-tRNA reductase
MENKRSRRCKLVSIKDLVFGAGAHDVGSDASTHNDLPFSCSPVDWGLLAQDDVVAYVLDSSMLSFQEIANAARRLKRECIVSTSDSVLIVTCQRIEQYKDHPGEIHPLLKASGLPFKQVIGNDQVFLRVARIASGALSQLLGERFITEQVQRAVSSIPVDGPVRQLANAALLAAQYSRDACGFYAPHDYKDLIFSLMNSGRETQGDQPRSLLVCGGGMLGRLVVAEAPIFGYAKILWATGSPKTIIASLPTGVVLLSPNSAPVLRMDEPFDCFIATDNPNERYRTWLATLLKNPNLHQIVDFSSCPTGYEVENSRYITMYDPRYTEMTDRTNRILVTRLPLLEAELNKHLGNYMRTGLRVGE